MLAIDRIVGNIAVCYDEQERKIDIPLSELPEEISEGDVLIMAEGQYQLDSAATEQRRAMLGRLQRQVFGRKEKNQ